MWTNTTDICMIDIRSLTTIGHNEKVECIYQGGTSISHFDIGIYLLFQKKIWYYLFNLFTLFTETFCCILD